MVGKIPLLSIVCPAYQEEEVLPEFHLELSVILAGVEEAYNVEIIYVDDGSSDRTLRVLRDLARNDRRVRYLSLSRNFGHQAALTAGLEHARGDLVISMDSDLQHPPSLVRELLRKWREGFDIVLTIREEDQRLGVFKRLTSRSFYRAMRYLSDTDVRLAAADYRLMSRKAVDALLQLRETHRFLRGMVQWLGFSVTEIPFQPAPRKAGASKYTLRKMFSLALDGLLSFSKLPLRLSLLLGLIAIVFSLAFAGGAFISLFSAQRSGAIGMMLLFSSIQFMGGCILLSLGIVGEYVGRIYQQVKGRPLYLLKECWPQTESVSRVSSARNQSGSAGWPAEQDQSAA